MMTYKKYKDSGIDWIGRVPAHWECNRLANWFTQRNEKVSDKDFEPLSVTKNGILPQLENAAKTNDGDNRKLVRMGDFVINSRSDRKGSSGISNLDGSVSLINIVMKLRGINERFTNYLLKSFSFIEEFYRNGHGIVADLWTTRFDEMKFIYLAIPPCSEQESIATFLDEKCGRIDEAIRIKREQIEKLKEFRQIIIHEAVTKGVDKKAPLKNSGIEWIGKIPKHWEVKRLKFVTEQINEKEYSKNSSLKYLGMENVESWTGRYADSDSEVEGLANRFYEGSVLFGKLRPYLAKTYLASIMGLCSSEFIVFRVIGILNLYLQKVLLSKKFVGMINASTYGAKMPRASPQFIANQWLPVPPLSEQHQIVLYLDSETSKIDQAIILKTEQIERLKEYKQSLINEAVTGKIKVSN